MSADTFVWLVREAEVGTVVETQRAFLTRDFRVAEEEEEEEE